MPWLMATLEDQRALPRQQLSILSRIMHAYLDAVMKVSVYDIKMHKRFIKIIHLIESPLMLFHPMTIVKALLSRKVSK